MGTRVNAEESSQQPGGIKLAASVGKEARLLVATLISVDTMDESYLEHNVSTNKVDFKGNPYAVQCVPAALSVTHSFLTGTGATDAVAGQARRFQVVARDVFNNESARTAYNRMMPHGYLGRDLAHGLDPSRFSAAAGP